jgi:hypothetical protein
MKLQIQLDTLTCREGGCGACVVTFSKDDPLTGSKQHRAVNSVRIKKAIYQIHVKL